MERVALYIRVSTEDQARHGLSIPEQRNSLEDYAKKHDMKVIEVYEDAGKSARKRYTTRPEFVRLLEDVKAEKFDTILFIKLDRWFRNVADYYEVQKILDAHNVKWRATQEDYETVTSSGRLKVNIMLSVSQDEADRGSERVKFVFAGKRERNEAVTGKVPRGYKIENKHIVLDPETAPIIRRMFDVYLETGSTTQARRCAPEFNYTIESVRKILSKEAYAGNFAGIKIPPIITQEEHERVLALRSYTVRRPKENRVYLFTGLVICPTCGYHMSASCEYPCNRRYEYRIYRCRHAVDNDRCTYRHRIRESYIEEWLLEHIDSEIGRLEASADLGGESHQAERDAVNRKLSKLSDLYINDIISMDDYKKRYAELTSELEKIPPDRKPLDLEKAKMNFNGNWQEGYMQLSTEDKAAFWHTTIKSITLDRHGKVIFELL